MSATLVTVGRFRPEGTAALEQYAAGVLPLLLAGGGQMRSRVRPSEVLVGENPPDVVFTMRFRDAETIRTLLTSPEYLKLVAYRNIAFSEITTFIAEDLPGGGDE
jgi:uncharacterized protein (DUF1330 family)